MHVRRSFVKIFGLLIVAALLLAVMPVGEVQAATLDVCPGCAYTTIQAAIDDASAGDTINVGAGTYVENLNMPEPVNLIGTGMPVVQGLLNIDHSGYAGSETMQIEGIRFETLSATKHDSIVLKNVNGITVKGCQFDGDDKFMTDGARAVQMSNPNSNVTIEGSTFENGYYVTINGYATGLTVKNSSIANVKSGINLQGGGNLVVEDTNIAVVAQGAGNDTYGIRFASPSDTAENMNVHGGSISVDKNSFDAEAGTYHSAIVIRSAASGTLTVDGMAIGGEVVNLSSTPLDASPNWWGSVTGPAAGTVVGDVKVNPWCYNETCTELFVADGGLIQDAIDAAADGNTILVGPGTYAEKLELRTPNITVQSTDGAGVTILDVPVDELTTGVIVQANMGTLTFDGFTVKNFTSQGIIQGTTKREGTTFHVLNNIVTPYGDYLKNGIQVTGDGSSVIGNEIDGQYLTQNWGSSGIGVVNASNVTVTDNKINGPGDYGIAVYAHSVDVSNVTITGNTIDGSDEGIIVLAYNSGGSDHSVTNVVAHNNTVINYPVNAFWVEVRRGEGTITNIDFTENWWGSAAGPANRKIVGDVDVDYIPWCGDAACSFTLPDENGKINVPGGIVIDQPGTYIIPDGVTIENNSPCFIINASNTKIMGESLLGAKCVPTDGSNAIDVAAGLTDIIIEGFEIDGASGAGGSGNGIHYAGAVTDTIVRDMYIHGLGGDGIYFAAQPAGTVDIQGNLFMDNAGVGVEAPNDLDVTYNAWGAYGGPTVGDGVSTNITSYGPWTHVDLSLVDSTDPANPFVNEVLVTTHSSYDTITYEVRANLQRATGAEFQLAFDPAFLEVDSVTEGSVFPDPATGTETVTYDNGLGTINFAGTASGEQTGEDLVLFTVTFTGKAAGASALTFSDDLFSMLPQSSSVNIYASDLADGEVLVRDHFSVTGTVSMQARTDRAGVKMTLTAGGPLNAYGPFSATSTASISNNLGFTEVVADTYAITITQDRYLDLTTASGKSVAVSAATTLNPIMLLGGDVNNSNDIGVDDASVIGGFYGTGTIADAGDANFDNRVNIQDLALVGGNFGKASATAYDGWTP